MSQANLYSRSIDRSRNIRRYRTDAHQLRELAGDSALAKVPRFRYITAVDDN